MHIFEDNMKNVLIIGFVWPEPQSTAAGTRMLQLIRFFLRHNYFVTFVSTATKTERSHNLESLGVQTHTIFLNDSSFDALVQKINPEIVIFDRFLTEEQFGWRITENCPNALKILDTEDLHFLRYARQQALKNKEPINNNYLVNDYTKREIASIYRCDLSLIISKFEFRLLKDVFHIHKRILRYLPFLQNSITKEMLDSFPTFNDRKDFIAIGNFKHQPNWEAVRYLKTDIWPKIRQKLPNASLLIYGAYTTQKVLQLHNENENFIIKGSTNNLKETFTNARVCLAPLLFGAGLKGKLIDSMRYGTPNITTSIGAEGMHNNLEWNGFIENNPNEFALKAIKLYSNQSVWEKSQQNGIEILNTCFSKEKFEKKFLNRIKKLQKKLPQHRTYNVVGQILHSQGLNSSKYFSKWIEEKNKNL
ncbi:glycosyltransferase [Lutibacter sp.]